jgi:hypothetical protein
VWIILKMYLEFVYEGVYWIDMAQDRDRWWNLVNTVMNILVKQKQGISKIF